MSVAREIAGLHDILLKKGVDPFAPVDESGLFQLPEVNEVLLYLEERKIGEPKNFLRLSLQALRVQYSELAPRLINAEFVATLPTGLPGLVRSTPAVVSEMIRSAKKEIILVGYEVTNEAVVELLSGAATRGCDVTIICDRLRNGAELIMDCWPAEVEAPRIFCDRERTGAAPYAKLHAKCLLVDGSDLLITSANFTFHGLHGNVEMGIRMAGASAAEARKVFSFLVDRGIVERINGE